MSDVVTELRHAWQKHGRSARQMGFWALCTYRLGHEALAVKNPVVRKAASALYGVCAFAVDLGCGVELNREAQIGPDLHLVHGWNIKIHPDSVIGARVGIMHDVTLGTNMERPGAPVIGDDVFIGAGARILGGVHIGNGARIAANSLVIGDVPAGATAVGVPARVMQYTGRPTPSSTPPPTSPPPPLAKTAERRRADRRQAQQPVETDRRQGPRRRPPSAGEH